MPVPASGVKDDVFRVVPVRNGTNPPPVGREICTSYTYPEGVGPVDQVMVNTVVCVPVNGAAVVGTLTVPVMAGWMSQKYG